MKNQKTISLFSFCLILTSYFFFLVNYPTLIEIFKKINRTEFHLSHFLYVLYAYYIIFLSFFLAFYLTAFKYCTKIIALFFIIPSSLVAYGAWNYKIIFSKDIVRSIFETNQDEMLAYLSTSFYTFSFFMLILPVFFVLRVKIQYPKFKDFILKKIAFTLLGCCSVIVLLLSLGDTYLHLVERTLIPVNYIGSTFVVLKEKLTPMQPFLDISNNAKIGSSILNSNKKTMIIFVMGETARAKSFSLNGYERITNPLLEKESVISFTQFYAFDTVTRVAVPRIFSHFDDNKFTVKKSKQTANLLDFMNKIGFNVTWYDNNTGSYNLATRVREISMNNSKYCSTTPCLDDVLIQNLPTQKELSQDSRNQFIVLHQKGSHGPRYFKSYPKEFKKFTPECESASLKDCSIESIVNAYDNTILYTDFILNEAVQYLKNASDTYNTALIYVSDHGESTGEYSVYLHGLPKYLGIKNQLHIPFIVWFSPEFKTMQKIDTNCLNQIKDNKFSHENIFHSVLGLVDVTTSSYNEKFDLFKSCKLKNI